MKAMTAEELPAVLFATVIIILFIAFTLMSYVTYFSNQGYIESKRVSDSIAESVFFGNGGMLTPEKAMSYAGGDVKIVLHDNEKGIRWESGASENASALVISSLAVLVVNTSDNTINPGRLEVHVRR